MTIEQFIACWEHEPNSGCWIWTKSRNRDGYGQLRFNGEMWASHRLSWEIYVGKIPKETCVLHTCDNPSCGRPNHLFLGTKGDNNRDRASKKRFPPSGEKHPLAKLSPEQVRRIRASNETLRELSLRYCVGLAQISRVRNGLRWSHIT